MVRSLSPSLGLAVLLLGCGPEAGDLDDVYPRNCGMQGPVELLEIEPLSYAAVERVGDHYLVMHSPDAESLEYWAVHRCGQERVRLGSYAESPTLELGVAGPHLLSCDQETGAVAVLDPTGVEPPRPLFSRLAGCRLASLGHGLAAQQRESGAVWFHPDPADPEVEPILITNEARVASSDWQHCRSLQLACDYLPLSTRDIRVAGGELLVVLENEALLAFSPHTLTSRTLDPGPVQAIDVLDQGRRVVVDRHLGPTLIVERETGASFSFCCYDGLESIQQLGDWLVKGSVGSPIIPQPPRWTNFRAHHLPSAQYTEVEGTDAWSPLERLTSDTLLVDIRPVTDREQEQRYVVWPATGERRAVALPGDDTWTVPGRDGAYALEVTDTAHVLRHLAGPNDAPRILVEDASVVFPTRDGRVVFERTREWGEPSPLWVMLPDERLVELEERSVRSFGMTNWNNEWPVDRDEVVYAVEDGDRWVLKRTVLP